MSRFINVLLFCVGWISGGGIAAFIIMALVESALGSDFNTNFAGGCLWGTFGVLAGYFLVKIAAHNAGPQS